MKKMRCADPSTRRAYELDLDDPDGEWVEVEYTEADANAATAHTYDFANVECTEWGPRPKRRDVH